MQHGNLAKHLGESGALVRRRWPELTAEDVAAAAGARAALARAIARRYGVGVGAAKQQVRDFLRTGGAGEAGSASGGKRARRAGERTRTGRAEPEPAVPTASSGKSGGKGENPGGGARPRKELAEIVEPDEWTPDRDRPGQGDVDAESPGSLAGDSPSIED